jgi:hypothetical protein
MSEANDERANEVAEHKDDCRCEDGPTMPIGDAAAMLGMSTAQVRRLCKIHERKPSEGLAFKWSVGWLPHTDVNGHLLRGHRMPYRAAVERLVAAKQAAERNSSV